MFDTITTKARLVAGAGILTALVGPVVLATPAHASTTHDGCTVTPGVPYFSGTFDASGTKRVDRLVMVTCDAGRSVKTDSEFWEQDTIAEEGTAPDSKIGELTSTFTFASGIGRTTKSVVLRRTLPQPPLDADNSAEVYHSLRFQVTTNGVRGSWTAPELSLPFTIYY